MKRLLSIVLIAVSVASAPAQTTTKGPWDVPRSYIVATLPASPLSGTVVTVTDLPSSPTDCSTGGGTKKGLCRWNGSGWDLLSGGGGSAPAGTAGALQYNTGSAFGGAAITGIVKANSTGAPTAATGSDIPNIAESQVTNLTTDLATKVPTTRTVNGQPLSADVTVTKSDVGLGNADNTSDANKPVSTATQAALDVKAPLANPTLSIGNSLSAGSGSGLSLVGSGLTAGLVYYITSDGSLTPAMADSLATLSPVMCVAASATTCLNSGSVYRFSSTQSWSPGQAVYLSDETPGLLTQTAPATSGHWLVIAGAATAADTIAINFLPPGAE